MHHRKIKTNEELVSRIIQNTRAGRTETPSPGTANFELLPGTDNCLLRSSHVVIAAIEELIKDRGNPRPLKRREQFVEPTLNNLTDLKTRKARKRRENPHGNDGVVAVEFLATGSHDYLSAMSYTEIRRYFEVCKAFFDSKMSAENCVHSVVHLDQRTPNAKCIYLPMICDIDNRSNAGKKGIPTWRYSAATLMGGASHLMREWQDELHAALNDNGYPVNRGNLVSPFGG